MHGIWQTTDGGGSGKGAPITLGVLALLAIGSGAAAAIEAAFTMLLVVVVAVAAVAVAGRPSCLVPPGRNVMRGAEFTPFRERRACGRDGVRRDNAGPRLLDERYGESLSGGKVNPRVQADMSTLRGALPAGRSARGVRISGTSVPDTACRWRTSSWVDP